MRRALAIACLAMLAPGAARADDIMVSSFANICMAAHGDRERALEAARKAGWMPVPASMSERERDFTQQQNMLLTTKDDLFVLIVAHGARTPLGVPTEVCMVAARGEPIGGLDDAAAAISGVASVTERGKRLYAWREIGGKHVAVDIHSTETRKLAGSGQVSVILVGTDGENCTIGLIVPST